MFNTPNSNQEPGSYVDLLKRITQAVQQGDSGERMLEIMRQAFEKELDKHQVILARAERTRLFRQMARAVLTGLVEKIESEK